MKRFLMAVLFLITLAACGRGQAAQTGSQAASPGALTQVSVAMGYIPDIQFAPFFVADKKGYFASEGLKVNYDWGLEVDGIKLVGAKQIDFAIAAGDQVIQARAQGIPIVYVANWFNAYPVEFISFQDKNITKPQDLVGKKVGLPCLCGATYTAWRAMLYNQKVDPASINVQDIGFTQTKALTQGTVDVVGVYANNEPVQLRLAGKQIDEIKAWNYAQLVGNGVTTNEDTIQNRPDLVRRFARALLKGISDSIANPEEALQISVAAVPEAAKNIETSRAVLNASVELWKSPQPGASRVQDWQAMEQFMRAADFIHQDVNVNKSFTNEFLP